MLTLYCSTVLSVCVCIYVCVLAEDVEIMSRVLRKFDRDGVVDPQAVALGETILQVSSFC
jgi:hypothetical protein